jgi:hypothetical protein
MKLLIMQFLKPLVILLEYSSGHPVLKLPQPMLFLSVERQIFTFTENNKYYEDYSS